jgi:hypothetical protein
LLFGFGQFGFEPFDPGGVVVRADPPTAEERSGQDDRRDYQTSRHVVAPSGSVRAATAGATLSQPNAAVAASQTAVDIAPYALV